MLTVCLIVLLINIPIISSRTVIYCNYTRGRYGCTEIRPQLYISYAINKQTNKIFSKLIGCLVSVLTLAAVNNETLHVKIFNYLTLVMSVVVCMWDVIQLCATTHLPSPSKIWNILVNGGPSFPLKVIVSCFLLI